MQGYKYDQEVMVIVLRPTGLLTGDDIFGCILWLPFLQPVSLTGDDTFHKHRQAGVKSTIFMLVMNN